LIPAANCAILPPSGCLSEERRAELVDDGIRLAATIAARVESLSYDASRGRALIDKPHASREAAYYEGEVLKSDE
jgi:hypothetical protein